MYVFTFRNTLTEWTPDVKNMKAKKVRACMLKTFNRMRRRVGFLIYQFVMPALQVHTYQVQQVLGLYGFFSGLNPDHTVILPD